MLQFFEWYTPADKKHWVRLKEQIGLLHSLGLSAIWTSPPMKGWHSGWNVKNAPYNLRDFGEFDQKGLAPTKCASKDEIKAAIDECKKYGIRIYHDAALNHKTGGDEIECSRPSLSQKTTGTVRLRNRMTLRPIPSLHSWGDRKDTQVDDIDSEKSNFDYMMCCDIDYKHPDVIEETEKWARWCDKEFEIDGFRTEALKHVNFGFITHLLEHVRKETNNTDFFCIGAGREGLFFDMRTIFDGTLVKSSPEIAVTFKDNHDTQPIQVLESYLIFLRFDGYQCLFCGDFYKIVAKNPEESHTTIPDRKESSYGP
ncbi:hypothetical protein BGZ51_008002 [Haplosporangium sp. Z 767]|nr:hypothetical protein BGZ51_008002 [Haplosporangium sp. Z 767]